MPVGGFNEKDAKRIARVVRAVEGMGRGDLSSGIDITRLSSSNPLPWGCVIGKNTTANDLEPFTIVALSSLVTSITPGDEEKFDNFKFGARPWNIGTYQDTNEAFFGITQGKIAKDDFGTVRIAGLTPVKINVSNATYNKWAQPQASDTSKMKSGTIGSNRRVVIESGTGDKWAVIEMRARTMARVSGELTGTLATGGTRSTTVKVGTSSTGETVDFYDQDQIISTTLTSSKRVYGWYDYEQQKAIISGWKC